MAESITTVYVLFNDELDDAPCDALLPGEEGEI